MIDDIEGARFLVARMAGLPRYPKDPVARNELVRSACVTATVLDDIRRAVDLIVKDWDRCPVPSEFSKVIQICLPQRAKRQCDICGGVGFVVHPYLITRERDALTGYMRKTVAKITRAEERELELASQEIVDAAEKCRCAA